jgi:hypothetical protein
MRNLIAPPRRSSSRQTLLSIVVAVVVVFSILALLKVNSSGAKQVPAKELLPGSIPRSPAVRKTPANDSMAAFLALDSTTQYMQSTVVDRTAVPLPRPRPKRL